jgi:hypothetical protein
MLRAFLPTVAVLGLIVLPHLGQAATLTTLNSLKLDVPTSDAMFPAGPGSDAINNNCLACHSADHVLNQPSLPRDAWQEVVNKMIKAYKAPVSPDDAKAIVDYLVRAKGHFIGPVTQARSDSILAPANFNKTKSAPHDKTRIWCWNIGHGLLPVSQGTDRQRAGS